MIRDHTLSARVMDVLIHAVLVLAALICLVPMIHLIAVSFSSNAASTARLVGLWPVGFNTENYTYILGWSQFRRSFVISVARVLAGTALCVAVTVLTAYPLSIRQEFRGKQAVKWILIFSMLFSGGLIPWFLALRSLGLINKMWALILPGAVSTWNIILVLNFFRQLPIEMSEAAEIDGASHWDVLLRLYLPLSLPVLATITLFSAVFNWNAWFDGLVVMTDAANYPLQTFLRVMVLSPQALATILQSDFELFAFLSDRSLRAAQIVVTTLPILVLYPLLQRYFIHGLTLGSVKE